ncbi:MAG: ABC transporter ATP-binding protein [Acidimicrobiales bacterium]
MVSPELPGLEKSSSPGQVAAIAADNVTKRFPGVLANDSVSFTVYPGEVHTILGENGAGKSTLAAMLCGLYQPDVGQISRNGVPVRLRSPREGLANGIGMVHQHFRLVDRFTVSENVILGDPDQTRLLRPSEIHERVAAIGEQFGLPVDPRAVIADLTVGERQRVEIVKMLYRGADVLLLDEPTAVLTPKEVEALFETVRTMKAQGKALVFISHKLREVMEVSDRVTVMRAGAVTGEIATADTSERHLAELMVGRPVETEVRRGVSTGAVALEAQGLTVIEGGQAVVDNATLIVRRGEIVGIAGVAGNGQRPLARALAGIVAPEEGSIVIHGTDVTGKGPLAARAEGLAFVPEDRLGTGLVPGLSITDNMILTRKRSFFVDRRTARAEAAQAIDEYEIKTPGTEATAGVLSGGNSQKVLIARELGSAGEDQVIILSSPTRGLDIGAAEFVRGLLHEARLRGAAILVISEDLDEVRSLSDQLVVLYRGGIALSGPTDDLALEDIGLAMAGAQNEKES